jgi:hypothetical protein
MNCKRDADRGNLQEALNDAGIYLDKHGISWTKSNGKDQNPWDTVLLFKTSATDLSRVSIQCVSDPYGIHREVSDWLKRSCRYNLWIFDDDGRHCGIFYGLLSTWADFHNPSLCELILLSSFCQTEVKQEDINAYRASLPREYPSSNDYYNEISDTSQFRHMSCWANNIMLIEWSGSLARRVAVGQIHVDAWRALGSSTKLIALV